MSSYSLFVSFFPQLIAGPIVHHRDMLPQFFDKSRAFINKENISLGIILFVIGLFKKTVIADSFIPVVSACFDRGYNLNFYEAWVGSLSYTLQLYFDFSGYSDMAIASALFFNISIPDNFNSPYKSSSIQDFWRRWHITLGHWLRDYIYIPLGGKHCSQLRKSFNLFVTFLVGGVWHGAGWNFVIWGAMHGLGLIIFSHWSKGRFKLNHVLSVLITFLYVHLGWVFFRSHSFSSALKLLKKLFSLEQLFHFSLSSPEMGRPVFQNFQGAGSGSKLLIMVVIGLAIAFFAPNSSRVAKKLRTSSYAPYLMAAVFVVSVLFLSRRSEFLYFQF